MNPLRAALALGLLAGPAAAEDLPWLGNWGGLDCRDPVRLGSAAVSGPSGRCDVAGIVPLGGSGATALRLDCGGAALDVVLLYDRTGDRLWLWDGPGNRRPRILWRCEAE
ncbi:hypothetical protein [Wenxinia saemankumensis]|uniref:Protease inhibitor Inh n=1 Tax=Wenxinia saemankumensis TaxID=1447782 RepID=A0A1M6CSA4_9RHOB|nr:hypothetical protein [Wenxinia saemankumensis]SHI63902.1 hypothetical protein SAMN05444417_1341 [Wenxinia saemankumensis]